MNPRGLELLDEARILGQESPARPDRIGASRAQRREDSIVIEIGRPHGSASGGAQRGAERKRFVCLANERSGSVGLGVERDTDEVAAFLDAELANRTQRTSRGLAAIQDRYSPNLTTQRPYSLSRW